MLDALKFVKGAIVKNASTEAATHYHITNGRVKSYNGVIALCSPITLDLTASPEATTFMKAIEACDDTTAIHLTKAGRLSVKSGSFQAYIKCVNSELPYIEPEGDVILLDGELLPAVKKLLPFVSTSDANQWARGILFRDQSAFATNNVVLIEHWLPYVFPQEVNVPFEALTELVRIGVEPKQLRVTDRSLTFVYDDDRWLKTSLYDTQWPDIAGVLDNDSEQLPVTDEFFARIKKLVPFVDRTSNNALIFTNGTIVGTSNNEESGAQADVSPVAGKGAYNIKHVLLLHPVVNTIDFMRYPQPCLFYGDNIRGAIMGIRI